MQLQVKSLVDVIIGFGNPFEDDCPEQRLSWNSYPEAEAFLHLILERFTACDLIP